MTCAPVLQRAQLVCMDTCWKITFVTVSNINLYCIGSSCCSSINSNSSIIIGIISISIIIGISSSSNSSSSSSSISISISSSITDISCSSSCSSINSNSNSSSKNINKMGSSINSCTRMFIVVVEFNSSSCSSNNINITT